MFPLGLLAISAVLGLLFLLLSDEVKAAHYDFDRCLLGAGLRPENPSIGPFLFTHRLRSKIIAPWKVSQFKNLRAIRWKPAFSTIISTFVPFCQNLRLTDWTRPCKRRGSKVNFIPTESGMVNLCTTLNPSPQWHLASIHCPDLPVGQRGDTDTVTWHWQQTTLEFSAGFAVNT